jgi:zinc/manganese transport system permease protein
MDVLIAPFTDPATARALLGAVILAISAGPIGVFLMLRRMSLSGDVLSHGILPGVAIAFLLYGFSVLPMTFAGFIAGVIVAVLAGLVSRFTVQREDSSLAAFYLISLAFGTLLLAINGSDEELLHALFGDAMALSGEGLIVVAAIATISLAGLAVIWRGLLAECLDPQFFRSVSRAGPVVHAVFMVLVVTNLVGGFQALGTLLAIGLIVLPAGAARLWVRKLEPMCLLAAGIGAASSYVGLAFAVPLHAPPGPAIILAAGAFYLLSLILAPHGLIRTRRPPRRHRIA